MKRMKYTLVNLLTAYRDLWLQSPVLRRLIVVPAPVLLIGFALGGLRVAMLLIGYLQLAFRAALPGEPVENHPLQRAMALAGGLTRMLFFTGLMAHAAWPFLLMAAAQAFGLLVFGLGRWSGTELQPLPLLSASAFLLLGLAVEVPEPAANVALAAALALTLLCLLLQGKQTLCQLRMRFHLA